MKKHKLRIRKLDIAPDMAMSLFSNVQKLDGAVLLDAANHLSENNQFSILAYDPIVKIQMKDGRITTEAKTHFLQVPKEYPDSQKIFSFLSHLHKSITSDIEISTESKLPFLCGWIGYFGYDINIYTDKIAKSPRKDYELPDMTIGFYANSLIIDHMENQVFLCAIEGIQPDWSDKLFQNRQSEAGFSLLSGWRTNLPFPDYSKKFDQIKSYLRAGDCYQINFAQRFSASYVGSEFEAYQKIREQNAAPFSAFMRFNKSTIISVSPERFLSVKDKQAQTKPIKGTRPRGRSVKEDKMLAQSLTSSAKDRAENLMIVDLLRNDLSKHCLPFSVNVPKLFELESFPAVHHLVSTITGKLKPDATPFDLLGGAFPGGSITGCPKVRAMQIIDELEPDKRSIYCGSIGYIGVRDDMDTNICIRTLLAEKGVLHCWAGGGIVIDSVCKDEYQESLDKVAKILPLLQSLDHFTSDELLVTDDNHQLRLIRHSHD